MACRGSPFWWSLLGAKQTLLVAAQMSAFDPKRTCECPPMAKANVRPDYKFKAHHRIGPREITWSLFT
jgi:hypothetical protein